MNTAPDLEFAKLDVIGRIEAIGTMLDKQDPMMRMHLAHVHKALLEYDELVHMLTDEQIAQLIAGQKKHVGTMLVKEITTKRTTAAKVPKAMADDF